MHYFFFLLFSTCFHDVFCLQHVGVKRKEEIDEQLSERRLKLEQELSFDVAATQKLIAAVRANDVPAAQQALVQGADPNALVIKRVFYANGDFATSVPMRFPEDYSCPMLHYATIQGWVELVDLLAHAPRVNLDSRPCDYEKEITAKGGWIAQDTEFANECVFDFTPLAIAASGGQFALKKAVSDAEYLRMVEILLDAGADIEKGDGITPLCRACYEGKTEIARLLIKQGAKVNVHQGTTMTYGMAQGSPLYAAVDADNYEIVRILCMAGAQARISWGNGLTLVDRAIKKASKYPDSHHKKSDTIEILLRYAGPDFFYAQKYDTWWEQPWDLDCFRWPQRVAAYFEQQRQAREISQKVLVDYAEFPQAVATLAGQYSYIIAAEETRDLAVQERSRAMETDEKELAAVREQRMYDAKRAEKEMKDSDEL